MLGGFGNYDAWKLKSPWDDCEEEPEPRCEECASIGFVCDDGSPVLPCPSCHSPIEYFDREFAA